MKRETEREREREQGKRKGKTKGGMEGGKITGKRGRERTGDGKLRQGPTGQGRQGRS